METKVIKSSNKKFILWTIGGAIFVVLAYL